MRTCAEYFKNLRIDLDELKGKRIAPKVIKTINQLADMHKARKIDAIT